MPIQRMSRLLLSLTLLLGCMGFVKPDMPISEREQLLVEAVVQHDLPLVRQLLIRGANIESRDAEGRTALLVAVANHSLEIARLLIERGADVNAQDSQMDSPLLLAGAEGTPEILTLILDANPDFRVYNRFGGTPLIPACERGHLEAVQILLKTEVDIDHVNNLGWTALLEAIVLSRGGPRHQKIVQLLVDAGANIHIADHNGVTPLLHARQKGFHEIVSILESAAARDHEG